MKIILLMVFLFTSTYSYSQNWFPLTVGNKWQFINEDVTNSGYSFSFIQETNSDTIIENKKYYFYTGRYNTLLRYDDSVKILYMRYNNNDYVCMDYNLNVWSTFSRLSFIEGYLNPSIQTATVTSGGYLSIFDTSYQYKTIRFGGDPFSYDETFCSNLGHSSFIYNDYQPGFQLRKLIRAIIIDSNGVHYYSDGIKPTIIHTPVTQTSVFDINIELKADHYYQTGSQNHFLDSVTLFSYYSDSDSIITNNRIEATLVSFGTRTYRFNITLDSLLMKSGFNFYYKIIVKDQGIVPEYAFSPDSISYIGLTYVPVQSWSIQQSNTTRPLNRIYFASVLKGYIIFKDADYIHTLNILQTEDGGTTWAPKSIQTQGLVEDISFGDFNHGFLAVRDNSWEARYVKTTNAGSNWSYPITLAGYASWCSSIDFIDSLYGWAIDGINSIIFKTTNGGTDWANISHSHYCAKIDLLNQTDGYMHRYDEIYKTTDGGFNWIIKGNFSFNNVYFLNADYAFSVGDGGEIHRTTNGGEVWTLYSLPTDQDLNSVYFYDSWNGYAVGNSGVILRTTDGGENWFNEIGNTMLDLYDVFMDANHGWIVGQDGLILRKDLLLTEVKDNSSQFVPSFLLEQNYPNPFNPSTKISWQSPLGSHQTLKVYDVLGREVATLVNEYRDAGSYEIEFQSAVGSRQLASGIYYYQLKVGDFVKTRKMILMK